MKAVVSFAVDVPSEVSPRELAEVLEGIRRALAFAGFDASTVRVEYTGGASRPIPALNAKGGRT